MDVERHRVVDSGAGSAINGIREDDKLGDDILEDFETYLQDISDLLTVSRMVSDSVIKGMVNAVEEEAGRTIAEKEAELSELKETLYPYHVGAEDDQCSGGPIVYCEAEGERDGVLSSQQCGRMEESLGALGNIAKVQLRKLEIDSAKVSDTVKRIDSGSEFVGLGGILPGKVADRWTDADKSFYYLTVTLGSVCRQADKITSLMQTSHVEWREEQEFLSEIEGMVTRTCIRGLQEQFEEKWEQNAKFCSKEAAVSVEKINEILRACEQLEAIAKSIYHIETEHLAPHGIDMGEECGDGKGVDYFYRKNLGHAWDGNGKHEVSKSDLPEIDPSKLQHMTMEELNHFYLNEITTMKRNHESQLHKLTEELYTLKREVLRLKERASSVPSRRDKEMDALRKKLQEFIPNLEHVIKESDKNSSANSAENIGSMKERLDSLVSENNHLKDSLTEKKKEISSLSLQVTDGVAEISQNSAAETKRLSLIGTLQSDLEDAHVGAALREDVYKCILRQLIGQVRCIIEESVMTNNVLQDIYETLFEDAAHCAEPNVEYEIEDSEVEVIIMQELCGVVFREALKDTAEKLNKLHTDYIKENSIRVSLELAALRKEKLSMELTSELAKERDQLTLAIQELEKLKERTSHQEILISEAAEELIVTRGNLVESQRQLEQCRVEVHKLDEQRNQFLSLIIQEKQNSILQSDAREREHKKQLESTVSFIREISKSIGDMENRVTEGCRKVSSRLENAISHVNPLVQKANTLKKEVSNYKRRLERKCSDLQKAEAEVDLLGDEVDALLTLLEKIYIALDHYSPILQHYPGVHLVLAAFVFYCTLYPQESSSALNAFVRRP